jgi:hypothetical protein
LQIISHLSHYDIKPDNSDHMALIGDHINPPLTFPNIPFESKTSVSIICPKNMGDGGG